MQPAAGTRPVTASLAEEEGCIVPFCTIDNKSNPEFTVLDIEMPDVPGLLRTLAWTLNGLDMVAHNAIVRTTADGMAQDSFWLLTRKGKKLSDDKAELLGERVRDFLIRCSEGEEGWGREAELAWGRGRAGRGGSVGSAGQRGRSEQHRYTATAFGAPLLVAAGPVASVPAAAPLTEFSSGPITVSNSEHPEYTLVSVQEEQPTPGFLLDVASGVVQRQREGSSLDDQGEPSCGQSFKFWLLNRQGQKLDAGEVGALLYVLSRCLGYRTHPTVPPDHEVSCCTRDGIC
eukprot:scaffold14.g1116.t1